jgi:hypothetical protein
LTAPRLDTIAASAFIAAAWLAVSPAVAPDYWDAGLLGLGIVLLIGGLAFGVAAWLCGGPRPVSTALFAVAPWSLGFGGVAYLGAALFIPLEIIASGLIFAFALRSTRMTVPRAMLVATAVRAASLLPFGIG